MSRTMPTISRSSLTAFPRSERQVFSQQVAGGGVALHKRVVDDGGFGGARAIAVIELAAGAQSDAHGSKVIRTDSVKRGADFFVFLGAITLDGDVATAHAAAEWPETGGATERTPGSRARRCCRSL